MLIIYVNGQDITVNLDDNEEVMNLIDTLEEEY